MSVRPGQDEEFLAAFEEATTIIAEMPGFRRLTLSRCLERESNFSLLHHFYEPFPTVEHYEQVVSV